MIFTVTRTYSKNTKAVINFTWEGMMLTVSLTPRQVTTMIRELQKIQEEKKA